MECIVKKSDLLAALQTVESAVSTKNVMPILQNILLELKENKLYIMATDLNLSIKTQSVASIKEEGAITLPCKKFKDIVSSLSEDEIILSIDKSFSVIIKTKTCKFKIRSLSANEFPQLPILKEENSIKISRSILAEMISMVSFAVSEDETRHILNGILCDIHDNTITLAATDGKRVAIIKHDLSHSINQQIKVIVPSKAFKEITSSLQGDGDLSINIDDKMISFNFNETNIISRLIAGEYPDYQRVVPEVSQNKASISRQRLLYAIKRAALLVTPDYQVTKFEFLTNKLIISKVTPDLGESIEELDVIYTGKEMAIGFNPMYISDAIANMLSETIDLEVTAADKPAVIRTDKYVYIILPMRLLN